MRRCKAHKRRHWVPDEVGDAHHDGGCLGGAGEVTHEALRVKQLHDVAHYNDERCSARTATRRYHAPNRSSTSRHCRKIVGDITNYEVKTKKVKIKL